MFWNLGNKYYLDSIQKWNQRSGLELQYWDFFFYLGPFRFVWVYGLYWGLLISCHSVILMHILSLNCIHFCIVLTLCPECLKSKVFQLLDGWHQRKCVESTSVVFTFSSRISGDSLSSSLGTAGSEIAYHFEFLLCLGKMWVNNINK